MAGTLSGRETRGFSKVKGSEILLLSQVRENFVVSNPIRPKMWLFSPIFLQVRRARTGLQAAGNDAELNCWRKHALVPGGGRRTGQSWANTPLLAEHGGNS
jgi:hypothetical protein